MTELNKFIEELGLTEEVEKLPDDEINWGPTGQLVYDRTYSRTKPDGTKESWPETVRRVVDGNLGLVDEKYQDEGEREALIRLMTEFKIIPAGRHLWAGGVKNAQHLFNCWVSGWTDDPADHFSFTFLRLMEGGGVGANYSNRLIPEYGPVQQDLLVEIVCDDEHPDYEQLRAAGVLSNEYDPDWSGAFVIEDSREGWASALVDLIQTHYREEVDHVRRVYDVSRVREAGRKLRTFGGRASGPLPLARMLLEVNAILSSINYQRGEFPGELTGLDAMAIDHAIAQCVVAGGVRRSARMSMMHWADPQVMDFITSKSSGINHWTTNISVEVDSDFWYWVEKRGLQATAVFEAMTEGMVQNGEPGFWDSSLSNEGGKGEPNRVNATNPCGEITLESWEPCNLGHINLAAFTRDNGKVDTLGLIVAHRLMTRFLIRATFSEVADPKSREVLDRNRRIGVGHLGVASFLAVSGTKFSEAPQSQRFQNLLVELAEVVERASEEFSRELRIPAPVKTRTVAPTGTIAKMPGVSEGIHPIFSRYFLRRVRFSKVDPAQLAQLDGLEAQGYDVQDDLYAANTAVVTIPTKDSLLVAVEAVWGARRADELVEGASDLTLPQLLDFQEMYQSLWADNAVSFTANIKQGYPHQVLGAVIKQFGGRLKGATVFPETSMPMAPYEAITKEVYELFETTSVSDGLDEECKQGACPIR